MFHIVKKRRENTGPKLRDLLAQAIEKKKAEMRSRKHKRRAAKESGIIDGQYVTKEQFDFVLNNLH